LNKKSAQKQKDQETTASRKPLFHQKGLDNKNVLKPKNLQTLKEPATKMADSFYIGSSNFLLEMTAQ
jgi:hypothetical protein